MSDEGAAPVGASFLGRHDGTFLSSVEDAGLNASAPPQQRWMDGWLVRTCPGKAQRARCINAVASGRRSAAAKLMECGGLYRALGLPMLVRITPFTEPASLDGELAALGYRYHDDTRVMVLPSLNRSAIEPGPMPTGTNWAELGADEYARAVGQMRGSSREACQAHAERIRSSPVQYRGFALLMGASGRALVCGQYAKEGELAGIYDIATASVAQRRGLATWLCKQLLTLCITDDSVRSAYLQVGAENAGARRIYSRLGFEDAYSYHYRLEPGAPAGH